MQEKAQPLPTSIPKPTPGKPVRYTSGFGLPDRTHEEIETASEEAITRQLWEGLRR